MQYFRFEGFVKDETWAKSNENRRVMSENTRKLLIKSKTFNDKHNKNFFYIVNASGDAMTAGIISTESVNLRKQIDLFLETIEIELNDICVEEITFHSMCSFLKTANRNDYIEDYDKVLERFGLEKLSDQYGRELIDYGENLINEINKKCVYDKAKEFLMNETFLPELDRIYAGKSPSKAKGHPVHYMVQTDDLDSRREVCRLLLQALYSNGRVQNKRYSFVDFRPGEYFREIVYEQLYRSNVGGTVIVRYLADDDSEDDRADCGRETIETLCSIMKKYRNQVLTVFCLPRKCTKAKDIFFENLGITSMVELKEEFVSGIRAENFLKTLAKEQHIRTDKSLFGNLEEDKLYLSSEIRELFDCWYNQKLKTGVYPQYKEISTVKHEVAAASPKGSAFEELQEMIGLSEAKKVIKQALDYYKAQKLFADKGMKCDHPAMHMVFTGEPGTAKTSVARLFAGIMRENGLLSKGKLIEVGRGDLVGKYVGWTAPIIQKKFKEAEGSVLFIDEAYSLVDDRNGSFGDEAINTIVQEMENRRDNVVVIFAGYPNEMEHFLQKNPGLRSRIAFHVPFADYTVPELCDIAKLIAKKKGLRFESQAEKKLTEVFSAAQRQYGFGNGRYVRNVIEKAKMAQATRLLAKGYDNITRKDIETLCAEDIEMPKVIAEIRNNIGFSA